MTHRYGNVWDAVECAAYDLLVTVDKHCREHRVRGGAHWVTGGEQGEGRSTLGEGGAQGEGRSTLGEGRGTG